MLLTAMVMPVLVVFAALGVGSAVVRGADSEAGRAADFSALAAAARVPTLGRPSITGVPVIPSTVGSVVPLDPPVPSYSAEAGAYAAGSIYEARFDTSSLVDEQLAEDLGIGPLADAALGTLGGGWAAGCTTGEAQFTEGRARLSRGFALDGVDGPLVPRCATAANTFPNDHQRIYLSPEMDSTGAYRLQRCLLDSTDCASQLGNGALNSTGAVLRTVGTRFTDLMASTLGTAGTDMGCVVNPVGAGCPLSESALANLLGADGADDVSAAFTASLQTVLAGTGLDPSELGALTGVYEDLAQELLGFPLSRAESTVCGTDLGASSGVDLCDFGVNLASLLPSIMTPRVRSIVTSAIDVPLVPSWVNGGGDADGDFDFAEMALARRTFKNAVVVPTMPGNFGPTSGLPAACLRGEATIRNTINSLSLGGLLGPIIPGISTVLSTVSGLLSPTGSPACQNIEADGNNNGEFRINLNPTLQQLQVSLIDAASTINDDVLNPAVNAIVGAGIGRDPAECDLSPPAPWCVDLGDQLIRDLRDIYDPPGSAEAPTMEEIVARAQGNDEPVTIISLSKYVQIPVPPLNAGLGNVMSALTYWVPMFDVVHATVEAVQTSGGNPEVTFKILDTASSPPGLFKAVKIDPSNRYPLCAAPGAQPPYCLDQPPA